MGKDDSGGAPNLTSRMNHLLYKHMWRKLSSKRRCFLRVHNSWHKRLLFPLHFGVLWLQVSASKGISRHKMMETDEAWCSIYNSSADRRNPRHSVIARMSLTMLTVATRRTKKNSSYLNMKTASRSRPWISTAVRCIASFWPCSITGWQRLWLLNVLRQPSVRPHTYRSLQLATCAFAQPVTLWLTQFNDNDKLLYKSLWL